jgi:hypothetical protein
MVVLMTEKQKRKALHDVYKRSGMKREFFVDLLNDHLATHDCDEISARMFEAYVADVKSKSHRRIPDHVVEVAKQIRFSWE